MKILYVHAKGEIGGSDISLLTILKNIDRKRFSPNVIVAKKGPYFSDYKNHSDKCEETEFSVLKSPDNLMEFLKIVMLFIPSVLRIWFIIKKWKIDLVHVNTIVIPSALIAAKLAGKPLIVHKREIITRKFISNILDLVTYLLADKVIAISNAVKNSSLEQLKKKTIVIYNGADISDIKSERQNKLRKSYNITNDTLLIGIFSRIEPWKGQHVVIEALPNVLSKFRNIKMIIFGKPYTRKGEKYFERLRLLVNKLNLQKIVLFPGLIKSANEIYSDFDLVILPSVEPEPLGRVLIESMIAKRVVIATNIGGVKEIIKNGKTGVLVEPKSVDGISDAVVKLLKSENLRETMGNNARKEAIRLFDMKLLIKNIEKIYLSMNRSNVEDLNYN